MQDHFEPRRPCQICKHINVDSDKYPCCECKHNPNAIKQGGGDDRQKSYNTG